MMKKSSFAAMLLSTASGVLFALGMCMVLIEDWNLFRTGMVLGCAGILLGAVTWMVWRKMERKPPIRFSPKSILTGALALAGALLLGGGMCLCMVWNRMAVGIAVGLFGIAALLSLVPITRGVRG